MMFSRRSLLVGAAGLVIARAARADILRTPAQPLGPFYPQIKPADSDADLRQVAGRQGEALGQAITVTGRVFDLSGAPMAGAVVEIWHADSNGRYHHPRDGNAGQRDMNFQGYGAVRTGADGGYRFQTIRPAAYRIGGGLRTPHIHYRVTGPDGALLVTQMYFPGEPLNGQDFLFRGLGDPGAQAAATARLDSNNPMNLAFDIVVA